MHTDLTLSGAVAQYGRGVGMIQATAAQIMNQFANNLKTQIARDGPAAHRTAQPPRREPRRPPRRRAAAGGEADLRLLADGEGAVGVDHEAVRPPTA